MRRAAQALHSSINPHDTFARFHLAGRACDISEPPPPPCCRGFDVFVNMVLEDVEEFEITPEGTKVSAG